MKSVCTMITITLLFFAAAFNASMAQIVWTKDAKNNPVLLPGPDGSWDDMIIGPFSVLFHDSTYHMWYGGNDVNDLSGGHFGYATSQDGISWEKYEGNPVFDVGEPGSWEDDYVVMPSVQFIEGVYKMWYGGHDGSNSRIGYATSEDGITWTRYEGNPVLDIGPGGSWNAGGLSQPCVRFYDGTYHMWFGGWGSGGTNGSIGYATSADGIIWTEYENNPVLSPGHDSWDDAHIEVPEVYFDGNSYHMWYTGRNTDSWFRWRIGYATSTDGINWKKYVGNPVLEPSADGWDSQSVGMSSPVRFDSVESILKMWYLGGSANWVGGIGYATAPLSILHVPDQFESIQQGIDAADSGDVVLVDEGTYYENINFKGKAITVASHYWFDGDTSHISKTIIDGSQHQDPDSGSVVYLISGEDTTSVLYGLTITGGTGSYNPQYDLYGAGGIVMVGGKIIHNNVINNIVSSEKICVGAGLGGNFQNSSCNAVIEYNEFRDNSINTHPSGGGGAMYIKWTSASGYIRISNNIITGNSVTCTSSYKAYGGGIGIAFDLPTAVNATIANNTITNNELHCEASIGAGIYIVYWEPDGVITDTYPSPVISNNIIANNYSEDRGAGIGIWTVNHSASSNITPQPAIINNTLANNRANDGCGIFNFNSYPLLMNNIFWNDLSVTGSREIFNDDIFYPDYWPSTVTNHGEVFIRYSDIQGGWEGQGNIDAYPAFVDTSSNDFSLLALSRCVGNGIDSLNVQDYWYHCPDFDYKGNIRPHSIDEFVDMGAIESTFIINDIIALKEIFIKKYSLFQNYPNPFNPVTIISYQLPMTNDVELNIFNVLGQRIVTLVNEKQTAGSYQVEWDATDFASGIYYYQLVAGEYREVKKMILLR